MPLDEETSEQFQQLMKKMIEQAGKERTTTYENAKRKD
jgi:hypothetical protein